MSTRPGSGKENGFRFESGQKQTFFVLAQKVRFRGYSGRNSGCGQMSANSHKRTFHHKDWTPESFQKEPSIVSPHQLMYTLAS